jgi:hypothetical protein
MVYLCCCYSVAACRQMLLTFHIYLHDLIGAAITLGPKLKSDMILHHVTAMIMICIGYCINLNRYAIMWQVGTPGQV